MVVLCHVILQAKLHDMYLYKTDILFHTSPYLKSVWKVALLHRFYYNNQCKQKKRNVYFVIHYDFISVAAFTYFSNKFEYNYQCTTKCPFCRGESVLRHTLIVLFQYLHLRTFQTIIDVCESTFSLFYTYTDLSISILALHTLRNSIHCANETTAAHSDQ